MRTHGGNVGHFPGTRLVAVGPARERAHGTNIDAHAALFAVQVILTVRNNRGLGAALADAKGLDIHSLVADAHAAETQYAARRIVVNGLGPFLLGLMALFLVEAALVRAISKNHILQFAFPALIAHRAIERMIGE